VLEILKKYRIFLIVMGFVSAIIVTLFYNALKPPKRLFIYSPADVNPELVDSAVQHIGKYHTISDFKLTNQNNKTVTQNDFEGKVYVADFFFTTCPTICPKMTQNMGKLQEVFKSNDRVMFLSHTVTPEIDRFRVLAEYARKKNVIDNKWHLVTGDKKEIFDLARRSYLAVKIGSPEERYDMVHTENFVLVDQKRRVRGFYDGTDEAEMERLIEDIEWLLQDGSPKS